MDCERTSDNATTPPESQDYHLPVACHPGFHTKNELSYMPDKQGARWYPINKTFLAPTAAFRTF
jgi:hypothetical protein